MTAKDALAPWGVGARRYGSFASKASGGVVSGPHPVSRLDARAPHGVMTRLYGSFSSKTDGTPAPGAGDHPVGKLGVIGPMAHISRAYGSFANKDHTGLPPPDVIYDIGTGEDMFASAFLTGSGTYSYNVAPPGPHPVGNVTRLSAGGTIVRRRGTFANKATPGNYVGVGNLIVSPGKFSPNTGGTFTVGVINGAGPVRGVVGRLTGFGLYQDPITGTGGGVVPVIKRRRR